WDVASGECKTTLDGHSGGRISVDVSWVNPVVFSHNSQLLASVSDDMRIKLWDVASGECRTTLDGHSGGVYLVVFSHDSQLLASASHDKSIKLWDVSSGECKATLETTLEAGAIVNYLAFDVTGSHLITNIGTFALNSILLPLQ